VECETVKCQSRAILKQTRERDTPKAILIKGTKIYESVPVLAGQCPQCQTGYHADHEHSHNAENTWMKLYLNSAKYLKVGQNIWVDRTFSGAVLSGIYNFHASITAFVEFWNMSFWTTQWTNSRKVSHCQVWQAFIQESVRRVASASGFDLELPDRLPVAEIAKQAFNTLGEKGVIRSAEGHACSECTHEYKRKADELPEADDPAGLVGIDENHQVPAYVGDNDQIIVDEIADSEDTGSEEEPMEVDESSELDHPNSEQSKMEQDPLNMNMAVLDGIVMGCKHCAFADCEGDFANYQTGVFCAEHERICGHLCHIKDCQNPKAPEIHTCHQHKECWHSHVVRFGWSTLLGVRRMLRRSEEEVLPWLPAPAGNNQPHDEPVPASALGTQQKNYFVMPCFYCVETICAPCGVVIAGTKFARAESSTNILNFLDRVYPDKSSQPDYICIDKACQVLHHAVASGRWNVWSNTTCFIVDSYHYINHRTTDYLC